MWIHGGSIWDLAISGSVNLFLPLVQQEQEESVAPDGNGDMVEETDKTDCVLVCPSKGACDAATCCELNGKLKTAPAAQNNSSTTISISVSGSSLTQEGVP